MAAFFGERLISPNTRSYICSVMANECSDVLVEDEQNGGSIDDCVSMLADLPSTMPAFLVDGPSQGCRAFHASLAQQNPADHCAHLSFVPLLDPMGEIKCQEGSSDNSDLDPSVFFSEKDLKRLAFVQKLFGIDPEIGFNVPDQ